MTARFIIDLDVGNKIEYDLTGYFEGRLGWVAPMYIKAEGNDLNSVFETCRLETVRKDGEEGPTLPFNKLPLPLMQAVQKAVLTEYARAWQGGKT